MVRAKANPDPVTIEYERSAPPAGKYTIRAWRNGAFEVERDGKVVALRAAQLGAYFGASRYPSNRMQDDAISAAKGRIEGALDGL